MILNVELSRPYPHWALHLNYNTLCLRYTLPSGIYAQTLVTVTVKYAKCSDCEPKVHIQTILSNYLMLTGGTEA
jgi:hypothetical protein